jgi:hypothetical protein
MTKSLLIVTILLLLTRAAISQTSDNTKNCYSDKPFNKEKAFTKMLHKPYFKGGHDSFVNFLMANISFQKLVDDLSQNERLYIDTARIKFIVSKGGVLSDLSIALTKKKIFADEIARVIKKSSCNWAAGGTERLLNGWIQFDIYYLIDRRLNEVTTNVKVKEYDYADD